MNPDSQLYLGQCEAINFGSPAVAELAQQLATGEIVTTAKRCFEFVRDEVKHSSDFQMNPVTCSAAEALAHKTGYCYAKSHLLCALLRANKIPAGLCYQRLSLDGKGAPYCLHGLNAVFLPDYGWYRVDARGNREGINAQFSPPNEQLAFTTNLPGECDLPDIYISPLPSVIDALERYDTWDALRENLPDLTE